MFGYLESKYGLLKITQEGELLGGGWSTVRRREYRGIGRGKDT